MSRIGAGSLGSLHNLRGLSAADWDKIAASQVRLHEYPMNHAINGSSSQRTRRRKLLLTELERRDEPSVALAVTATGVLRATTTNDSEVVRVSQAGAQVVFDYTDLTNPAQSFTRAVDGVRRITVSLKGGNNQFINDTSVPSVVFGGAGADILLGGSGGDKLYGRSGDDYLDGRDGRAIALNPTSAVRPLELT
jgi:Ca2+-binding RTX toxin-like protein